MRSLLLMIGLAATLVACGGGVESNLPSDLSTPTRTTVPEAAPSPIASPTPEPTLTEVPSPTPAPPATPPVGQTGFSIDRSGFYFDVLSGTPGWQGIDAETVDLSNADLGLGESFSEVTVFISEQPFQVVYMFLTVASGSLEIAANKAQLRDQALLESQFLEGLLGEDGSSGDVSITWSTPTVGDDARLARTSTSIEGVQVDIELLIYLQEEAGEAALVFIGSVSYPFEEPSADVAEVGRAVDERLCIDAGC